jgi:outer membrane protein
VYAKPINPIPLENIMYRQIVIVIGLLTLHLTATAADEILQPLPHLGMSNSFLSFARSQAYVGLKGQFLLNTIESPTYFHNDTAGYHLLSTKHSLTSLDFVLRPHFSGYRADDTQDALRYVHNGALHGGVRAGVQLDNNLKLHVSALTDVLGKNNGQELSASLGNAFQLNRSLTFTPSLGLKWQNDRFVNYYYGTSATALTHPLYQGKPVLNYTAGLNVTYLLHKNAHLFANFEVERLGKEILDSTLVDDNNIKRFYLGYGWRF